MTSVAESVSPARPGYPTLEVERSLWAQGAVRVIGVDEVGRGAIAGPVAVGAALLSRDPGDVLVGLRDSKLVPEKARGELAGRVESWVDAVAVGSIAAVDIDKHGITRALAAAARDALRAVGLRAGDVVVLDGVHDWLSPAIAGSGARVRVQAKADRDCAVVAAASVVAKVQRDAFMVDAHASASAYGWDRNKGYGSAGHFAAIEAVGPHELHRRSWLKPTLFTESDA